MAQRGKENAMAQRGKENAMAQRGKENASSTLRVGTIFPLRGPIGELGQDSFDGANVALQLVNDRGGVRGRKLEWVLGDGFDPREAAQQAERMIVEQDVKIIVGCYGSNHSIEVSKVAEKHKATFWVQTAWTADFFNHQPKYSFRTNTYARPVEETAVAYVVDVVAPRLGKSPNTLRVAVINENSAYGRSCGAETITALRERGIGTVLEQTYDPATDELTSIVQSLRSASPDVLFASSFIEDAVTLLRVMRQHEYRPQAIMTSSAGFGLYTVLQAGEDVDGILSANAPALVNAAALNPTGRRLQTEFVNRLRANTGREPTGFNAMGFVAAYSLFNDVLPDAKTAEDADEVRTAALAADVPLGSYPNGWGLKLDQQGQNQRCPACIDQWQGGSLVTIGPPELAVSQLRNVPLPMLDGVGRE